MRDAKRQTGIVLLALLLIVPSVAVLAPQAAADPLYPQDGAPATGAHGISLRYHAVTTITHLFFHQSSVQQSTSSQQQPQRVFSTSRPTSIIDHQDPYSVKQDTTSTGPLSQPDATTTAVYTTSPVAKNLTIQGGNSLGTQIAVHAPPLLDWHVAFSLYDPSTGKIVTTFASTTWSDQRQPDPQTGKYSQNFGINVTVPFVAGRNSVVIPKGDEIQVQVWATPGSQYQVPGPGGLVPCDPTICTGNGGWALYYDSSGWKADSGVLVTSPDAMEVALWAEDVDQAAVTYLTDHGTPADNIVSPRLAIQSAWGLDDLKDATPQLHMQLNGAPYSFALTTPDGTTGDPVQIQTLVPTTAPDEATQIYGLPNQKVWSYDKVPHGTYDLLVSASVHDRPVASDLGWRLIDAHQSIGLAMFHDDSTSHPVQPGGSTTFLVNVTNGGAVNDTLSLSLGSNKLVDGWRGDIAGPRVKNGNEVTLAPGKSTLLRVTVNAPADASLDTSALFQLKATSSVDSSESQQLGLVASVSDQVTRGVAILPGADGTHVDVRPNGTATLDVLVWNRGSVPTTLTAALDQQPVADWNASLLVGGQSGQDFNLPNVPAGDIVHVTVEFRARDPTVDTYTTTVNATYTGNQGTVPTLDLTARVKPVSGLTIDVLAGVDGQRVRYMEMACQQAAGCPDENGYPSTSSVGTPPQDSINVTWMRAWITNAGDKAGTFNLSIAGGTETPLVANGGNGNAFTSYKPNPVIYRLTNDGFAPIDHLRLKPGQTGEVYLKVRHHGDDSYATTTSSGAGAGYLPSNYTFTLRASGAGASASRTVTVQGAENVHQESQVALEAVARLPGYFDTAGNGFYSPLVNARDAANSTVRHAVVVGAGHPDANTTYCVRVTDGNTFRTTYKPNGDVASNDSVRVTLRGLDRSTGWRAELRKGCGSDAPWGDAVNFAPPVGQGWTDQQVEVRVFAPNITKTSHPLAGDTNTVTLHAQASWGGSGSSADLNLQTRVANLPLLTMKTENADELVQVGKTTAFVVNLYNNGSAPGTFHLKTHVTDSAGRGGWTVTPSDANLTLDPYQHQTLALLVSAPGDAAPGDAATVALKSSWLDPRTAGKPLADQRNLTAGPLSLQATVVASNPSNLKINASQNSVSLHPGGSTEIPFTVLNPDANVDQHHVHLSFFGPANWTAALSRSDLTLAANEQRSVSLVLQAPDDVLQGGSFAFVVKAQSTDQGDDTNFALYSFTVTISSGEARPVIHIQKATQLVDRNGSVRFQLRISNVGTAPDTFPLIVDQPQQQGWHARLETADGTPVTQVQVDPSVQQVLYLNVTAPQKVNPGTRIPVSVEAYASDYAPGSKAKATVTAVIQDYNVGLKLARDHVDYIPGTPYRVHLNLTNLGNGNDTLNVSMSLQGLGDLWTVQFSRDTVRLHPGESQDIVATLRSPTNPLPTPRSLTFQVWAGSEGAAAHQVWQNRSTPLVVNVLNYRASDVDGDGHVELAVDLNRNPADGFEHFQEISRDGANTTVVLAMDMTGDHKTDFLLDNPSVNGLDGIADVFWDPSHAVVTKVPYAPDINGDGSPDYLVDSTGDHVLNLYVNAVAHRVGTVTEVHVTGKKGAKQYLVDTNGDGTPNAYFDPAKDLVTQVHTDTGQGSNVVGVDTTGDGRVNKYFNTQSQQVYDAQGANLAQFAGQYWYLFVLLVAILVALAVVVYRRRTGPHR